MIQIKKSVVSLEEKEVIELQQIILDENKDQAFDFLKYSVYNQIISSQILCGCNGNKWASLRMYPEA
ncbi:MAG: hypothetical protein GY865_03160 [candidate division Zixibacteria bacterium]|nr:hypothetical protein [candidate division Zixibacteria bacterium]